MKKLIVLAALAAACGNARDVEPAAADVTTYQKFCTAFADLDAARFAECDGATPAYVEQQRMFGTMECPRRDHAVSGGRLAYDRALAGACFEAFRAAPCSRRWDSSRDCQSVVAPLVPPGGACGGSDECDGGWCTAELFACGTCRGWIGAGESCVTVCEPGQLCVSISNPCAAGLVCAGGLCVDARAPGGLDEPCGDDWPACEPGLFCDSGAICRRLRLLGESCADGAACIWGAECFAGLCTALPAAADACAGVSCPYGEACVAGTCVAPPAVGDPCEPEPASFLGACVASWCGPSGRCEPYAGEGAACADAPCAFGLECLGGRCGPPPDACAQ